MHFSCLIRTISFQMPPERHIPHTGIHLRPSHLHAPLKSLCTRSPCSAHSLTGRRPRQRWAASTLSLSRWLPSCWHDQAQGTWFCPGQEAASHPCIAAGIWVGCCSQMSWASSTLCSKVQRCVKVFSEARAQEAGRGIKAGGAGSFGWRRVQVKSPYFYLLAANAALKINNSSITWVK